MKDGSCSKCPDYKIPNQDQRNCIPAPPCEQDEMMKENGKCQKCLPFTRNDGTGKACAPENCGVRYILLENGTCQKCQDYTKPN